MSVLEYLLDLIYPPHCMFCHKLIEHGRICEACHEDLPILGYDERKQRFNVIENCSSLFYYEKNVRESLLRYKFHGLRFYSEEYAKLMLMNFTMEETECDLISWVPLSSRRLRERGYDQARLIAEQLSRYLGLPCARVLKKVKNVRPQSQTGEWAARTVNIKNAYRVSGKIEIRGKTILLIDDIVTTGATLEECAATLMAAGAASVKALTIARRKD